MAQPIEPELLQPTREDSAAKRPRMQAQAFKPPLDVIADEGSVVLELVLPGVDRSDVTVERVAGGLMVHGIRPGDQGGRERAYHYTETPRGPFARAVPLPFEPEGDPAIELDRGVLRIRLATPNRVDEVQLAGRSPGRSDGGSSTSEAGWHESKQVVEQQAQQVKQGRKGK